jgi:hypothetical protein
MLQGLVEVFAFQAGHDIIPPPGGKDRFPGAPALGAFFGLASNFLDEIKQDSRVDIRFHGLILMLAFDWEFKTWGAKFHRILYN